MRRCSKDEHLSVVIDATHEGGKEDESVKPVLVLAIAPDLSRAKLKPIWTRYLLKKLTKSRICSTLIFFL